MLCTCAQIKACAQLASWAQSSAHAESKTQNIRGRRNILIGALAPLPSHRNRPSCSPGVAAGGGGGSIGGGVQGCHIARKLGRNWNYLPSIGPNIQSLGQNYLVPLLFQQLNHTIRCGDNREDIKEPTTGVFHVTIFSIGIGIGISLGSASTGCRGSCCGGASWNHL